MRASICANWQVFIFYRQPLFLLACSIGCFVFLGTSHAWAQVPQIDGFTPISGPVGTTVVITGSNFNPTLANNLVFFGGILATKTAGSTTSLTVTVPLGASPVCPIVVINTGNGFQTSSIQSNLATNRKQFVVTNPPVRAATSIGFATNNLIAGTTNPRHVVTGDFNNDNRTDVVIVNSGSNNITVFLGQPFGAFSAPNNIATGGSGYFNASVGDFNSDGNLDLVLVSQSNRVGIMLGNGAGGFAAPVTQLTSIGIASHVVAADFNGDGRLDALTCNQTTNDLSYFAGNGDGTLQIGVSIPTGAGTRPFAGISGDFNNDRIADFAFTGLFNTNLHVMLGNGLGGFSAPTIQNIGTTGLSIATGDANNDGLLDLIVGGSNGNVYIFSGNGAGVFTALSNYGTGGTSVYSIGLADFNADGNIDIATAIGTTANRMTVAYGNGSGTFGNLFFLPSGGTDPNGIAIGDFNRDGFPDVVISNAGSTNNATYFTMNAPTTPLIGTVPTSALPGAAVVVGGTGFNPNAANDVFFGAVKTTANANATGTSISTLVPLGASTDEITVRNHANNLLHTSRLMFRAAVTQAPLAILPANYVVTTLPIGTNTGGVWVSDFNNDNYPDIAIANYVNAGADLISIRLNNGIGGFNTAPNVLAGPSPTLLKGGDLNGDGNADLAVVNFAGNSIHTYLGNGSGGFDFGTNLTGIATSRGMAIGDVNNDGKLDVFGTGSGLNSVNPFLGVTKDVYNNLPSFTSAGANPEDIEIADFNNDGTADLAVVNLFAGGNVSIFLGVGDGSFNAPNNVPAITNPTRAVAADVNNDNNLDLLIVSRTGNNVFVRLGNGAGAFTGTVSITVDNSPEFIVVGDLNGDGNLDFATANSTANSVSICTGLGNGNFNAAVNVPVGGTSPVALAIGDFNLDGKPDLVTANNGSNNISILTYRVLGTINSTSTNLTGFSATGTTPSVAQTFSISGINLSDNVILTCTTTDYEVSLDNVNYTNGLNLPRFLDGIVAQPVLVYARLKSGLTSGIKNAFFQLTSTNTSTTTISISGVVNALAQITVGQGGQNLTTGSNFPFSGCFPTSTIERVFTLSNSGTLPLTITSVVVSGDFTIVGGTPTTIAGLGSASLTLRMGSVPLGNKAGALSITSDAVNTPNFALSLSGLAGVPTTPENFSVAVSLDDGQRLTLSWNDIANNECSFELQRAAGNSLEANFRNVATFVENSTRALVEVNRDTTYFFRLRAVNGLGNSAWSNISGGVSFIPISVLTSTTDPLAAAWQVFPNPSAGIFTLQNPQFNNQTIDYQVFNVQGQLVGGQANATLDDAGQLNIDLNYLPAGKYVLYWGQAAQKVVKVLVKE